MKRSIISYFGGIRVLGIRRCNAVAQQSSAGTAPVHVGVTVEAHKGGETPVATVKT